MQETKVSQCELVQTETHIMQECQLLQCQRQINQVDINNYQLLVNCDKLNYARLLFGLIANV